MTRNEHTANIRAQTDATANDFLKTLDPNWTLIRNEKDKLEIVHVDGRRIQLSKKATFTSLARLIK